MKTRRIGDLEVSTVGLGCNNFGWHIDAERAREVVDAALAAGITLFDTADVYGDGESERMLGAALGDRRDEVVVATKFGYDRERGGGAPDHVRRACEASLERLGTDRLDLYYLHRPDPATPIADTLGAMGELVDAGKVRAIACSNFGTDTLHEAESVDSLARFAAVQNEFSLLERAPESEGVLGACRELGVAFVPYFPLKSGLLTGKYRKGDLPEDARLTAREGKFAGMGDGLLTEENLDVVERLAAFAEERARSLLELAFSWLLAHDTVASVIAGATRAEQVRANAGAAGWDLGEDDMREIDRITGATAAH